MKATIEHLVHCCKGDERPDCPILDNLANVVLEDIPVAKPRARHGFPHR
jgi:MerR family copper efflux transcriptional regulator